MHRLEAQGYVAAACTRQGTLMVDPKTGQRVTVKARVSLDSDSEPRS